MQQAPVLGLLELVPAGSNGVCASRPALRPEVGRNLLRYQHQLVLAQETNRALIFSLLGHYPWPPLATATSGGRATATGKAWAISVDETLPGCPLRFWGWVLSRAGTAPIYISFGQ